MDSSRRSFLKIAGVAGIGVAGHDFIAELLAQSPSGQVMQSRFKGLSDIALTAAKSAGCSYADVRFTMTSNIPGGNASFNANGGGRGAGAGAPGDPAAAGAAAGAGGGGRAGRGGGGGGGRGGGGFGGGRGGRGG